MLGKNSFETNIRNSDRQLLETLLMNRTTNTYIRWATSDYAYMGTEYAFTSAITPDSISGQHADIIRARCQKSQSVQAVRTKAHAEVYTPSWMCNRQNNLIDSRYFGRSGIFNTVTESGRSWQPIPEKITFPENRTWKDYVDSCCLEICCGEAPYLVSRYDAVTGQPIPIQSRIGLLDRKLRIVSENALSDDEWTDFAIRAVKSIYGYEFQGDSLFIARFNVLLTFVEYFNVHFHCNPNSELLHHIADIISWNIWQMDGLENSVSDGNIVFPCIIKDWQSGITFPYSSLFAAISAASAQSDTFFRAIVGNPPFQLNHDSSDSRIIPRTEQIYRDFTVQAIQINPDCFSLLLPARWFSESYGLKDFRAYLLNGSHITRLIDCFDSTSVFDDIAITGGVCCFLWERDRSGLCELTHIFGNDITTNTRSLLEFDGSVIRSNRAVPIVRKVLSKSQKFSSDIVYPLNVFGISSDVRGSPIPIPDSVRLIHSRGIGYLRRDEIRKNTDIIDRYKVLISPLIPHAGEAGVPVERGLETITVPRILKPGEVTTSSYLVVGSFWTKEEAENYRFYLCGRFARFMLRQTYASLHITRDSFRFVPMLDFSRTWTDEELYAMYELTAEEIAYIERIVRPMTGVMEYKKSKDRWNAMKISDTKMTATIKMLPLKKIQPPVGKSAENWLVNSVRETGIIDPIIVMPCEDEKHYEIVTGESRCMAAQIAGFDSIPCIIIGRSDAETIRATLRQSALHSRNNTASPMDIANAYLTTKGQLEAMDKKSRLRFVYGNQYAPEEHKNCNMRHLLADYYGTSEGQIKRYLDLTQLSADLQEMVDCGKIRVNAAIRLAALSACEQKAIAEGYKTAFRKGEREIPENRQSYVISMKAASRLHDTRTDSPDTVAAILIDDWRHSVKQTMENA